MLNNQKALILLGVFLTIVLVICLSQNSEVYKEAFCQLTNTNLNRFSPKCGKTLSFEHNPELSGIIGYDTNRTPPLTSWLEHSGVIGRNELQIPVKCNTRQPQHTPLYTKTPLKCSKLQTQCDKLEKNRCMCHYDQDTRLKFSSIPPPLPPKKVCYPKFKNTTLYRPTVNYAPL